MLKKRKVLLLVKKYLHGGNPIMNKNLNEKELYRRKIIEMVEKIKNVDILEYLHTFIKLFLEKWD